MPPDELRGPVLAFDTSGPWIIAGTHCTNPEVTDTVEEMERGQAERLMPLLEEHLARAGLDWRDLGAIAVGTGPGNFTGVRIAVAAARGLALGLGIPAVGLSQFEMLQDTRSYTTRVLVSLPAPRGQAYVQPFLNARPLGPPRLLTPGERAADLEAHFLCVIGYEAQAIAAGLGATHDDVPWQRWNPLEAAKTMAVIVRYGYCGASPDRPAPLYVRPADAAPPSDPPPVILP